jgi:mRNA-degrading endonuclease toxin of MazEF toxin-antitoxin module
MKINRGDVVWAGLSPTIGREQAGHRPFLVLSDDRLHSARQIIIALPMTSKAHPIPTHYQIAPTSFVLCEQPKSFSTRRVTKVEHKAYDIAPVRNILNLLIGD